MIGRNIAYSFSRGYFKQKFETENLEKCTYENFDLNEIEELNKILTKRIFTDSMSPLHSKRSSSFFDRLSATAEKMNAVNTIKFHEDGSISGHNTDVFGFEKSLLEIVSTPPKKALILGTGGASSAVAYVMKKLNIEFSYISRSAGANTIQYEMVDEKVMDEHHLIINASPVGTFPDIEVAPQLPYSFLTDDHVLYDLIYNPPETRFLQEGKKRGCKILNGQKMLEYQAEKSWEIWNQ